MAMGIRRLPLVALSLLVSTLPSGCGVIGAEPMSKLEVRYLPLTTETFAAVTTRTMFRSETTHMDLTIGDESMAMDLRLGESDELAMAGTYDDGTSVARMRFVDGEVYIRDETDPVWFQFPDYLADQVTAEMDMGNPATMTADFAGGIESVTYLGAHEVEYGQTHRYDLTMRKDYLADELGIPLSEVPDVAYTVWLDDDYLMRRVNTYTMGYVAVVEFGAWGEPVTIEPPPAGQVDPLPVPTDDT